jgi:hypothetical protein
VFDFDFLYLCLYLLTLFNAFFDLTSNFLIFLVYLFILDFLQCFNLWSIFDICFFFFS